MSIFKDMIGVIGNIFQFGNGSGPNIKNNSAVIEFKNAADNAYAVGRALELQSGAGANDIAVRIDSEMKVIEFSFNGGSPPSAGANTGKYGMCHTAGGSYTAGRVYYDTGSALQLIPLVSARIIVTTDAISGTVSFNADGVYGLEGGTTWVLKGDGTSPASNTEQCIKVAITHATGASASSTASVPSGAVITRVVCDVTTLFNTAATVQVVIDGSTDLEVMSTAQNDLTKANQYEVDDIKAVGADNTGVVKCVYTDNSASAGAADIYVFYVTPSA